MCIQADQLHFLNTTGLQFQTDGTQLTYLDVRWFGLRTNIEAVTTLENRTLCGTYLVHGLIEMLEVEKPL